MDSIHQNIAVVRPTSFEGNFARFDGFVDVDSLGNPICPNRKNPMEPILAIIRDFEQNHCLVKRFSLIGFSKGCVVLNGLCDCYRPSDYRLERVSWLDGGHSGNERYWPKSAFPEEIRQDLVLSSYQINKSPRSRMEIKEFGDRLRKLKNGRVENLSGFKDSLEGHFRVVDYFLQSFLADEANGVLA